MNVSQFVYRVLLVVAIVVVTTLLLLFLGSAISVILISMAAILVAIFFDGIARWIYHRVSLSKGWCRLIAVVAFLVVVGGVSWALSPYVSSQASQLTEQLPNSLKEAQSQLQQLPGGKKLVSYIQQEDFLKSLQSNAKQFFSAVFGVVGALGNIYIILFMGLLILATPEVYVEGIIHLIPKSRRDRGKEVLVTVGQTIRSWLSGQLLSMLIVAVFTWIGLMIIGIPLALILGIIAGLLAFIPNFGPVVALLIGVLFAATQGLDKMLWTAGVYILVQVIESNLITPFIQRQKVSLPMALIVFSQLTLGVYTGVLGLLLATPIFAVTMVLVKMLYVEDVLGDHEKMLAPEEKVKEKQS